MKQKENLSSGQMSFTSLWTFCNKTIKSRDGGAQLNIKRKSVLCQTIWGFLWRVKGYNTPYNPNSGYHGDKRETDLNSSITERCAISLRNQCPELSHSYTHVNVPIDSSLSRDWSEHATVYWNLNEVFNPRRVKVGWLIQLSNCGWLYYSIFRVSFHVLENLH